MKCIKCGNELKKDSIFCNICGKNQTEIKKNNKKYLIIIAIIGVLLVVGISFSTFLLFQNNNKSIIKEKIVGDTFSFDKYKIRVLDGFQYFTNNENRFLKNDDCTIEFMKYPLTLTQINNHKTYLIDTLSQSGYDIVEYIDNKNNYITIRANMADIEYGLAFYTKEDITIFFKIVSNNLSNFDSDWFSYIDEFINNMYEEEYYE